MNRASISQNRTMDRRSFLRLSSAVVASTATRGSAYGSDNPTLDEAWYETSRRFAALRMGRIAYVDRGSGSRVALFLHGFPLNSFQWRGALERLSPYRRCIAPDLMGMGYSEISEDQELTPTAQVGMIASLLDSLKVSQVDVIANDAGGIIAQLLTAAYPERVRTLLLSNCDVDTNNPPSLFHPAVALAKRGLFAERYLMPQVKNKELARSVRGIGAQFTYPELLADSTIDMYFDPLVSSPTRMRQVDRFTDALGDNVLVPMREKLSRWKKPARMVWAMQDNFFGAEWADWLDKTLTGSRGVRRLEGANLFFPEEMPDVIAQEAHSLWTAKR